MGQTVNLLAQPSVVRIHPYPPLYIDSYMNFKDIVLIKSKVKGSTAFKVTLQPITIGDVLECFFPMIGSEYSYLGYSTYDYPFILPGERLLRDFFKEVDRVARPWWCPKFVLRLLDLFGNDGSLVRLRNRYLSDIFYRLTKGIRITDTKWKYDTFRIYGNFTEDLQTLANKTCREIEKELSAEL